VWRRLALEGEEAWPDGADGRHTVVEELAPGEHRCTVGCSRGFRRLLAGQEILEVSTGPLVDEVVRVSFTPLHFGRTHVAVDAGYRLRRGRAATPFATGDERARRCHARAAAVERQAAERMRAAATSRTPH